ncbi:hypothetical protein G6L37_02950 [Agrobacterium rubi]|nr:hypothetical protein [Agrobacterium rubi]NTF24336.1 hypothetical protein [Agrobacterium rubi]
MHRKSRPDSDIELTVEGGWRPIGRINRVGRKWIARFEVEDRDPFEHDFTSRKAAVAFMQTASDEYTEILAATEGFDRLNVVVTRNGMFAGDLAELVDILTGEEYPVVIPTGLWERKPQYHVVDNETQKHMYLAYVGTSRRKSGIRDQGFLIEDARIAVRLVASFPKDVTLLGQVAIAPAPRNLITIQQSQKLLREEGARTGAAVR